MSWINDLAGRAENLLNKLDQNAATVLQSTGGDLEPTEFIEIKCETSSVQNYSPSRLNEKVISEIEKKIIENGKNQEQESPTGQEAIKITEEIVPERIEPPLQIGNNFSSSKRLELERKVDELTDENSSLIRRNLDLEMCVQKYNKSISELQVSVSKNHQIELDLKEKLTFANNENVRLVEDLSNYRSRAQNTLQMKEKIIEELKSGRNESSENKDEDQNKLLQLELDQMKIETSNLNEEIKSLKDQLDNSRLYISKIEENHKNYQENIEVSLNDLQEKLKQSEGSKSEVEKDLKNTTLELRAVREEMVKQTEKLSAKVYDKTQEVNRLEKRLNSNFSQLGNSKSDAFGSENRIKSLTQSLIEKQEVLEQITAERNALRIQIEKMETQYLANRGRQQQQRLIEPSDSLSGPGESIFFSENSSIRKRFYWINFQQFLRQYPIIFIYVMLLHIWVMIVIVSKLDK